MITPETYLLLVSSKIKGIGNASLRKIIDGGVLPRLSIDNLHNYLEDALKLKIENSLFSESQALSDFDVNYAIKHNHHIISVIDSGYPTLLKMTPDKPILLFANGDISKLSTKALAIIGTRAPTEHGAITAERITDYFSKNKWQIISGLALGIDSIAHKVTLKNSGLTVAILANGLDTTYPSKNKNLAHEIIESGGILLSENPYRSAPIPARLIARDRIQAGLSAATIMIQSDTEGGSWHASRAAIGYNRHLLIPKPTNRDIAAKENKINGNLFVANKEPAEVSKFLKCCVSDLNLVRIINSKNEYATLEDMISNHSNSMLHDSNINKKNIPLFQ